jgi:hypothetical protein
MADLVNGASGAVRAADVLLRCAGGRSVLLRMPANASAGDTTEQLGLAVPEFQDVELTPVVFRKTRQAASALSATGDKAARWELMVSAIAVQALVGSLGYSAGSVLFAVAFGVLIDGVLMEIVSATESELFGTPYVYRLVLQSPLALVV